jgi:hypothetical protein
MIVDRYLEAQRRVIEISKWIKGVEISSDPGDEFVHRWAAKYAAEFSKRWPSSKCKDCCHDCAHECRSFCEKFEKDPKCQ